MSAADPPSTPPLPYLEKINRELLDALIAGKPVSGEALAARLGLSRTAVWKHMTRLKAGGLPIEARTGQGYRLSSIPDRMLPVLLNPLLTTRAFGRSIDYLPEIDSTNNRARELVEQGAPEGTLVIAEHQTRGRGRMDRSWASPPGENLLFSILLRPAWPPQQTFSLIMLASVSLCDALASETGLEARIKWPNDIYLNRKKAAGILAEFAAESDRLAYVIIGIGVNVNWFPENLPPGSQPATSLQRELGNRVSRLALLASFLNRGEALYYQAGREGVGILREKWEHYSLVTNQPVQVETDRETWTGTALGIDEQGALLVRLDSGEKRRFYTGDVHLRLSG